MAFPFVVDASVSLSWCFEDEITPYSLEVLGALETTYALAPGLWPFETTHVLALADRRGRISRSEVEAYLSKLERLPIQVEKRSPAWLWQSIIPIAREQHLSGYDAAYLELARRERLPLATLDRELRAPATVLDVPLFGA